MSMQSASSLPILICTALSRFVTGREGGHPTSRFAGCVQQRRRPPPPPPADVEVSKLGCDPQASTASSLPIIICFAPSSPPRGFFWRSAMGREGARCVEHRRHLVDGSRPAVCASAQYRIVFLQRRKSL
ncbi:hypothetical protein B0H14DRAFT_2979166, partial [Mycena olivaceomarginata]